MSWVKREMNQLMRLWYLSHRRSAKAQASLRIRAVSPEPSLVAHIKCGSRQRVRPTSPPKGNDRSPESQHAQKGFFQQIRAGCSKQICSRAGNSKVNGQMWPEFELKDFTPVLVTCQFDDDLIKNKVVISRPHFLHYKPMWKKFNAQGHVTLKRIVRSGLKWDLSKILCLSSLSASLKKIRSKLKVLLCPQYFIQCSRADNSVVDGWMCPEFEFVWAFMVVLVTCKFDNTKMRGLIRPKIVLNRAFMPVLVTSNFDDDLIKNKVVISRPHFLHYKPMWKKFNAQGHVTLKRIVRSGLKWDLSKILCLSSLSASLKKIRSKLKVLLCPQYFIQCSRADNSVVDGWMCPEFEFVWAFMVVLVTCKFDNTKMRGLIRPKIVLNRAFMPVLVTSNFDDDSIKYERASMETPFSHYKSHIKLFRRSRAANSVVSGPIWPKFELVRDSMHVLVNRKYKKDRIKNNREKVETSFSPL